MPLKLWKFFSGAGVSTALLLFFSSILFAEPNLLSPQLDQLRIEGFRALYNMDYATAKSSFEAMTRQDPKEPAGYVYLGSAMWLEHLASLRRLQTQLYNRNNAFFRQSKDQVDPKLEKEFYDLMSKTKARGEARLKNNKNDLKGLYYLGIMHGAIAGYETTVKRSFLSSLQNGTKAVDFHRRVLKLDPSFIDANVSVGMYNYVVGTLPLAVKVLMLLGGVHGSKTEGLNQLEKVWKNGKYAREEAGVILVMLYDREKRFPDALKILQQFKTEYPANPVFRLETAAMLARLQRYPESFEQYEALLQDPRAIEYMPDLVHFYFAQALFETRSWQKAYEHYVAARRISKKTPVSMITMTHLRAGQCLNALHRDEEAKIEYQYVLQQPNVVDSRDVAKKFLKNPYHP
jgi:tetratricopeptide (TPR) repeat protein